MKAIVAILLGFVISVQTAADAVVELVTRSVVKGMLAGRDSGDPELSADGRWLAFVSDSEFLGTNRTRQGVLNVFLRDNETGTVKLLTGGVGGAPANGHSYEPSFTQDGTKLLFRSDASNLAAENAQTTPALYVHDLGSGETRALELGEMPGYYSMTPDGRKILFESVVPLSDRDTNWLTDLYLHDVSSGSNEVVSLNYSNTAAIGPGNQGFEASVSDDGRYVAYVSGAEQAATGAPRDVYLYVRDMLSQTNILVPRGTWGGGIGYEGGQSGISGDGRFLFFTNNVSLTTNLPGSFNNNSGYWYDAVSHTLARFRGEPPRSPVEQVTVSGNSERVAFVQGGRLYVKDLATDQNRLVTSNDGVVTNVSPSELLLSRNGRFLVFATTNQVTAVPSADFQYYVFDQESGASRLIGDPVDGGTLKEAILSVSVSDTGLVAFATFASNLGVDGDATGSDVFLMDAGGEGALLCVSVPAAAPSSESAAGHSYLGDQSFSSDGRIVGFSSQAADLVPDDTNGVTDIFLYDGRTRTTRRVSAEADAGQRRHHSRLIGMSADGNVLAYYSKEGTNRYENIFVYDARSSQTRTGSISPVGERVFAGHGAALSLDGRYLLFTSGGRYFIRDLVEQQTYAASSSNSGATLLLSPAGRHFPASEEVVFSGDESRFAVFRGPPDSRNRRELHVADPSQPKSAILVASNAIPPAALSYDASLLLFQTLEESDTGAVVKRIQMRDGRTGTTTVLPLEPEGGFELSGRSILSDDGRFVLVAGPSTGSPFPSDWKDFYVFDRVLNALSPVNRGAFEADGTGPAGRAALSADGRAVVFASMASDLVPADLNLRSDIFVARFPVPDANGNEIDDGWETQHPEAADPAGDTDADGFSNWAEYQAGTDPQDGGSMLRITGVARVAETGAVRVSWSSIRGKRYDVQRRSAVTGTPWEVAADDVAATGHVTAAELPARAEGVSFYRVSLAD